MNHPSGIVPTQGDPSRLDMRMGYILTYEQHQERGINMWGIESILKETFSRVRHGWRPVDTVSSKNTQSWPKSSSVK